MARTKNFVAWAIGSKDVVAALKRANAMTIQYSKDASSVVFNKRDLPIKPLIVKASKDASLLANAMKDVRDTVTTSDATYTAINKVFRSVAARAVQQERRARHNKALKKAIELYGEPPSFNRRLTWVAELENEWAGHRLAYLDEYRAKAGKSRLSREESNQVLETFWDLIDKQIDKGDLPDWS